MQTATDMSMDMASKEAADAGTVKLPICGTIISTNGHKITSKLNPDAKEFYPAYLLRQKIMREIGDVGGGGQQNIAQQPTLHFTHNPNVLKVIKLEGMAANQMDTDVDALKEGIETTPRKAFKEAQKNELLAENKNANKNDENEKEKEKENNYETEESEGYAKAAMLILEMQETEKQLEEEDLRASEEDGTDLENFEDAEGEPMAAMKRAKESEVDVQASAIEVNAKSAECVDTKEFGEDVENHEQYSDEQGSNDTLNEFKCKDDTESVEVSELSEENELAEEEALHELPQILEEIKECNSLCGDGERDVEYDTEGICECVGVRGDGDVPQQIINEYQSKLTTEANAELATSDCDAPPNTPTEFNECKSVKIKSPGRGKGKTLKEKDDKKKAEKRTTLRKLASISLSLRGKSSSAHHTEKASTRTPTTTTTRTKRLSESLHNLTSGLKSKVDGKKTESGGRFLPRSATNIPRPPTTRTRTTLARTAESNGGMTYKSPKARSTSNAASRTMECTNSTINNILKDVTSLKSASSSEHVYTMKSAAQLIKKPLSSKSASSAASEKSGIPTVSVTKSKDSVGKTRPRGTLASTLRQNEAQKRRNLFPNDDDESNIELSQFLFK